MSRFSGPVSYASAPWEPVDWQPFDVVATGAYRDAGNAGTFRDQLCRQLGHGKPLAITEFGCASYAGAADRGGMGWAIVDEITDPPRLDGDYVRDETEQVNTCARCTRSSPKWARTWPSGSPSPARSLSTGHSPGRIWTWPATA